MHPQKALRAISTLRVTIGNGDCDAVFHQTGVTKAQLKKPGNL
jgi:hypothetical protein